MELKAADYLAIVEAAARGFAQGLLPRSAPKRTRAAAPAVAEQQAFAWPSMSAPEEIPFRSREIADEIPPISARELEEIMNRDPEAPPPGYYERDNPAREEMVNAQLG